MVTDAANQAERGQKFLCLHAAGVILGFILALHAFLITWFIPEILHLRQGAQVFPEFKFELRVSGFFMQMGMCYSPSFKVRKIRSLLSTALDHLAYR